eukprot:Pompholyxophrys_punicea_v1_NODE_593_length_1626_cov_24.699936.p3 type:complete len:115 gc:universal NODE_593_length_1626_cov_24.699936:353-697(+)
MLMFSQFIHARVFIHTRLTRARAFITTHSCSCFHHNSRARAFLTAHSCSCFHHNSFMLVFHPHTALVRMLHHNSFVLVFSSPLTRARAKKSQHNSLLLMFSSQLTCARVFITTY